MNKYTALTIIVLSLVGCGAEEPINDVEFYQTHEKERVTKIEWCKKSAERRGNTNCLNAHSAQAKIHISIMLGEGIPRS